MKRSLNAFAMYNKDVGYTQSMNYIIGFFLILNGGDDEDAFWLFTAVSRPNQYVDGALQGFYQDSFPLYHQFVYQFTKLFEEKHPELKEHLDEVGMMPAVWLQKWFMTLFLYSFPMKLCIRIWDLILVEGFSFLFKFPLALMELYEDRLLAMDLEMINDLFQKFDSEEDESLEAEFILEKA